MKKLKQFLTSSPLIKSVLPTVEELVFFVEQAPNQEIKLFYGETHDEFGVTIDSLKYYFVLSLLHKYLETKGCKVSSTIIQADVASLLNKSSSSKKNELIKQKTIRLNVILKIINIYNLPIKVELMSKIFDSNRFQEKFKIVDDYTKHQKNEQYFNLLEKTVLQNKISQEYQANFRYAQEAIAISMLFDIKLGPPREIFYDQAQHLIAKAVNVKPLYSVYLQPSYPLRQSFAYFLNHPEIEKYGLTPYKAGSNKLQEFRILLHQTSFKQIENLITHSFESKNDTAHPVLDMYFIGDLAKRFSQDQFLFPSYSKEELLADIGLLKVEAVRLVKNYIFERLDDEK